MEHKIDFEALKAKTRNKLRISKHESSLLRKFLNINTKPRSLSRSISASNGLTLKKGTKIPQTERVSKKTKRFFPNLLVKKAKPVKKEEKQTENYLNFRIFKKYPIVNPLVKQCFRYINSEKHFAIMDKISSVIVIQTIYRGYKARRNYEFSIKDQIQARGLDEIITLQRAIKRYLYILNFRKQLLLTQILGIRNNAAKSITSLFSHLYYQNLIKRKTFFSDIIELRRNSIMKIQNAFRKKLNRKRYLEFKKKTMENYFFTYPFYARRVQLKVFTLIDNPTPVPAPKPKVTAPKPKKKGGSIPTSSSLSSVKPQYHIDIYLFEYSKFLKSFVLFLSPSQIKKGKYRCQFIVDGEAVCDGRYNHVEFSDGLMYNMIDFYLDNHKHLEDTYDNIITTTANDANDKYTYPEDENSSSGNGMVLDGMTIQENEVVNDLRKELMGKAPVSQVEVIRKMSFSKIEGVS